jgi:DNA-binding SARP family transcriptional activator
MMSPRLSFQLLGPVGAYIGNKQVTIGSPRQRTVLAMLLVTPDRVVSVDRLAEAVWWCRPPTTYQTQIAICVAGLRKAFRAVRQRGDLIVTSSPGYMLVSGDHQIDYEIFDKTVLRAQEDERRGRPEEAARELREALALWRGPALSGIPSQLIESLAASMEERRLTTFEHYAELQLQLGNHEQVIAELLAFVNEHPLREHARAALMLAHYRSGRRAEALELFQEARRISVEELGLEPGKVLQDINNAILSDNPLLVPVNMVPTSYRVADTTSELPPAPRFFVGRDVELNMLDRLLPHNYREELPLIGTITGRAGIGKSTLLIRWAHQAKKAFPNGVLYADLNGHVKPGAERDPSDVLLDFLRTLGFADSQIPADLSERTKLYHRSLRGSRVLVVLDNAANASQIAPLLPSSGAYSALVSGRELLLGNAAVRIRLGVFSAADALRLLHSMVQDSRVTDDPQAAELLANLCDYLPAAAAAAAQRLAVKPHWSLRYLVSRMQDPQRRLDELYQGEPAIRTAFDSGYERLGPVVAKLYRRMGLIADLPATPAVRAALLDADPLVTENATEQMADAGVLDLAGTGADGVPVFSFPALLQLHAAERAEHEECPEGLVTIRRRAEAAARESTAGVPRLTILGPQRWKEARR